ncbi:MAG: PilZ domain-containing protein [Gammaproteobacteria bacterium]|nr:PilZ domain-containing protein [Gammaproteobacteria bacterium]
MQDERRTTARRPVDDSVMIAQGPHYRLCRTRDLSLDGAMLDIGWSALTRNAPVEILLTLSDGDHKKTFRLPGEVARVSAEGTAVRFREMEPSARRVLSSFLGAE